MTVTTLTLLGRHARRILSDAKVAEAALEARLIVENRTGTDRATMIREPEREIDGQTTAAVAADLARRIAGEPVHRIIGHREFHGLTLRLSQGTLEPRDDTEALVDLALPFVRQRIEATGMCRILDLGTGTGAIALALLAEAPKAHATGVDISADALATARLNAERHGLSDRFATVISDWFESITGEFDAIVSNPPYIRTEDIATLAPEVRDFDPHAALDGGPDGLEAYRRIAAKAHANLAPLGMVFVEVGHDQAGMVKRLFADRRMALRDSRRDLGGHVRALSFASDEPA